MAFRTKSIIEHRDDLLRTLREGLIQEGISDPDIGPGTEAYLVCSSVAQHLSFINQNLFYLAEARMPDSATSEDLNRLCAIHNLQRRPATASVGFINLRLIGNTASAALPEGNELIDKLGQRFKVSTSGTYAANEAIALESINTGTTVNIALGEELKFKSPPPNVSLVQVTSSNFVGGDIAEDDASLRTRLLDKLAAYPGSGNWSHVKEIAEASHPNISAFIYPCYNGPATLKVVVTQPPNETNRQRNVSDDLINTKIQPAVVGLIPGYAEVQVISVTNQAVDVAINLALSEDGAGWIENPPYPAPQNNGYCRVTSVSNAQLIEVDSANEPVAGLSRIAFIDSNYRIHRARVLSFSGVGPYTLTLDAPLTGIATNDWIFPDAANVEKYLSAVLDVFADLGPGQVTDATGLLPRALRKPDVGSSSPQTIGASLLKFLVATGSEVLDASFSYRSKVTPSIPIAVTDPCEILIPGKIAFYRSEE